MSESEIVKAPAKAHSRWGIASFVFVVEAYASLCLGIILLSILRPDIYARSLTAIETLFFTSNQIFIALYFILLIAALPLGIVGMARKDRKRIFAILGVAMSAVSLVFVCVRLFLALCCPAVW